MAAQPNAERVVGLLGRRETCSAAPKKWGSGSPGIETAIHSSDGLRMVAGPDIGGRGPSERYRPRRDRPWQLGPDALNGS